MWKPFHIGDVLTITTGKLVSPRLMDGAYEILNYMTGDNLFTHQLPRAAKECAPWLLRQHPTLAEVDASTLSAGTWKEWLADQVVRSGEYLEVEPIPPDDHVTKDPITELREMAPHLPIILVDPGESHS